MLRFLSFLITLPLTLLVVDFAVSNRQSVPMGLFPLVDQVEMPLFLPVVLALVIGLLAGAVFVWLSGHGTRVKARREAKRAQQLERELAEARTAALLRPEAIVLESRENTPPVLLS